MFRKKSERETLRCSWSLGGADFVFPVMLAENGQERHLRSQRTWALTQLLTTLSWSFGPWLVLWGAWAWEHELIHLYLDKPFWGFWVMAKEETLVLKMVLRHLFSLSFCWRSEIFSKEICVLILLQSQYFVQSMKKCWCSVPGKEGRGSEEKSG